jgi:hypothetical protein
VVNGNDANEKVHLRQWYVPKYPEPRGIVWAEVSPVPSPDIIKEYTWLLLDTNNNPNPGRPGDTSFIFPIADNKAQCGLDDYDIDGDGEAEPVYLATTSAVDPDMAADFQMPNPAVPPVPPVVPGADGLIDDDGDGLWPYFDRTEGYSWDLSLVTGPPNWNIRGNTRWIELNTDEMTVQAGDEFTFLDHKAKINSVSPGQISVDLWYSGQQADTSKKSKTLMAGQTVSMGRHNADVETLTGSPALPPGQSIEFKTSEHSDGTALEMKLVVQPWYLQLVSAGTTTANIVIGRFLVEGETFFVDGAEYDVAMLYFVLPTHPVTGAPLWGNCIPPVPPAPLVCEDWEWPELKFITIRNPLPKVPVVIQPLTITKCVVGPCPDLIPLLPPFNMEHDMIDDINIPDCFYLEDPWGQHVPLPDIQLLDNYFMEQDLWNNWTGNPPGDGCDDITFLDMNSNTIDERWVKDVDPAEECWEQEEMEPRFDTNLLEEKFYNAE